MLFGRSYGVPEGLVFGFPCVCKAGRWKIVDDLYINDYSRKMLDKNIAELEAEKAAAQSLAPPSEKSSTWFSK